MAGNNIDYFLGYRGKGQPLDLTHTLDANELSLKGKVNGLCNRTACLEPGATWFNHSTLAYYCSECAETINNANRADAMRLFGHDLCTQEPAEETINPATV